MNEHIGKRVLVKISGSESVNQTVVNALSPSGRYVHLTGDGPHDTLHGWFHIRDVRVVEVLDAVSKA